MPVAEQPHEAGQVSVAIVKITADHPAGIAASNNTRYIIIDLFVNMFSTSGLCNDITLRDLSGPKKSSYLWEKSFIIPLSF